MYRGEESETRIKEVRENQVSKSFESGGILLLKAELCFLNDYKENT